MAKGARVRRGRNRSDANTNSLEAASAPTPDAVAAQSAPIDRTIDEILLGRGWTVVERSPAGDVYDWLDHALADGHEPTYVIVAANDATDSFPPLRVWLGDGQRMAYNSASQLAADLERIESHWCFSA